MAGVVVLLAAVVSNPVAGAAMTAKYKRYSPQWQEWHNRQVDRMVKASTSNPTRSDDWYRERQQQIERMPPEKRHDAYELLLSYIGNNHPSGFASDIYEEIACHAGRNSIR